MMLTTPPSASTSAGSPFGTTDKLAEDTSSSSRPPPDPQEARIFYPATEPPAEPSFVSYSADPSFYAQEGGFQTYSRQSSSAADPASFALYGNGAFNAATETALCSQKAVAFLAGPRERICVMGQPIEFCPRCRQEGLGNAAWRPHRHIGELKIRYICERHFEDLESNHHFDIPLCPLCNSVLYLYEFNALLGVSNARRLHKYVLKCNSRHVLPLLDLFCQTKKGGERCYANFKLQWCYGTMVKRCEAQKNRDHDLWWVRYKNEWKQRRTIIRYKKDFLSHLSDTQRGLLLGLGLEGEPPPDPKGALGPTFDALISSAGGSPQGPKIKKRGADKSFSHEDGSTEFATVEGGPFTQPPLKRSRGANDLYYSSSTFLARSDHSDYGSSPCGNAELKDEPPSAAPQPPAASGFPLEFLPTAVLTGTPMTELRDAGDGRPPVAVHVVGELCRDGNEVENQAATSSASSSSGSAT